MTTTDRTARQAERDARLKRLLRQSESLDAQAMATPTEHAHRIAWEAYKAYKAALAAEVTR